MRAVVVEIHVSFIRWSSSAEVRTASSEYSGIRYVCAWRYIILYRLRADRYGSWLSVFGVSCICHEVSRAVDAEVGQIANSVLLIVVHAQLQQVRQILLLVVADDIDFLRSHDSSLLSVRSYNLADHNEKRNRSNYMSPPSYI